MFNVQHLAIFGMLISFLPMVITLECYQCLSQHSFEDCDNNRLRVKCLYSHQCVKASAYAILGAKDEGYVKGCAATCSTSGIAICSNPNVKCEINCCSSDYCNGASSPAVSGLLLIFIVIVVYLFEFSGAV